MVWTYSGDPASSNRDASRFLLGDVVKADPQLADEEIDYLIDIEGGPIKAAARGAEVLSGRYARQVDKTVGSLSISASQRSGAYAQLAKRLWAQATNRTVVPWAGGLSKTDKQTAEANADRVDPSFVRELMRYRGTMTPVESVEDLHGLL